MLYKNCKSDVVLEDSMFDCEKCDKISSEIDRRVTRREDEERRSPLLFFKNWEKMPKFSWKMPCCGHLCVKFLI